MLCTQSSACLKFICYSPHPAPSRWSSCNTLLLSTCRFSRPAVPHSAPTLVLSCSTSYPALQHPVATSLCPVACPVPPRPSLFQSCLVPARLNPSALSHCLPCQPCSSPATFIDPSVAKAEHQQEVSVMQKKLQNKNQKYLIKLQRLYVCTLLWPATRCIRHRQIETAS